MHLFSDSYSLLPYICVNLCTCIHYHHTLCTPRCLRDCLTLCFHLLCPWWGPERVLCCHQQVVVHDRVCRLVCSPCIRAWKHVPDLVMPHSLQHPCCVLSIEVRGLLCQVQMNVSYIDCTLWAWDCTLCVACNLNPSTRHHKVRVSLFSLLKRNKKGWRVRGVSICLYVSIKYKCEKRDANTKMHCKRSRIQQRNTMQAEAGFLQIPIHKAMDNILFRKYIHIYIHFALADFDILKNRIVFTVITWGGQCNKIGERVDYWWKCNYVHSTCHSC